MHSETTIGKKTIQAAKDKLKTNGWSMRHAAAHLGYSYTHFVFSLTGRRPLSRVMFEKIMLIPICERPRKPGPRKAAKS
jgi:hypothetical protein